MNIDWDIEELACRVSGKSEEETEKIINDSGVDEVLYEKYGTDFDTFSAIVKDLLPFTPPVQAGISGNKFHAFVDCAEQRAIVRIEMQEAAV